MGRLLDLFMNKYPYTDFHELNLSWLLEAVTELDNTIEQFVSINALKYADPIQWNITSQYEKNTIVIDPVTGVAYISVKPVPSGVALTNTDYWTVVFDLGSFVVRAAQNFTEKWEQDTTTTATFPTTAGDWLVWGDILYRAKVNITAGDTYVIDSNIEHITMEEIIGHLENLNTTDKSNLVAAINELLTNVGALEDLPTTDKSSIVNSITEIMSIIGSLSDLTTTNKDSIVSAINELDYTVKHIGDAMIYFPSYESGTYSAFTALMTIKDKCILIDCGDRRNENAVLDFYDELYANGAFTNIDYVIISHYHSDHTELLGDILSRYPHNDCHAYIPMSPSGYFYDDSQIPAVYTNLANVISDLTANDVPYTVVNADTTLTINEIGTVELFNSDPTAYTYYLNNSTNYNDYSMVTLVHVGKVNVMFPGDIQRAAQDYIVANRTLPRIEVYAIHHHNIQDDDNLLYLNEIRPAFGVISTNHSRQLESAIWGLCADYACDTLVSTAYSAQVFTVDKNAGSICSGRGITRASWRARTIDFYVDNTYAGNFHDGSAAYPFTNINEANLFMEDIPGITYVIHVAETAEVYPPIHLRDYKCNITIKSDSGKAIINGCYINNCTRVEFITVKLVNNLSAGNTVTCDIQNVMHLGFDGCEFDASYGVDPVTRRYTLIGARFSNVYFAYCDVYNYSEIFDVTRYSVCVTNQIDFHNVGTCYRVFNKLLVIRGVDTVDTCDYYLRCGGSGQCMPCYFSLPLNTNVATLKALFALNDANVLSHPFIMDYRMVNVHGPVLVGSQVSDLDDATMEGYYTYDSSASNRPTTISSSGGCLLTIRSTETYFVQLAFVNSQDVMKIGMRKHGPLGWTAWAALEGV